MTDPKESSGGNPLPQFSQVASHYQEWFGLEGDRLKLSFRQGLFRLSLVPASLFVLAGLFLTALALVLYGSSLGIGEYFEGRPYIGFIIMGGLVLIGFAIFASVLWLRLKHWRKELQQLEFQTQKFRSQWKEDLKEIKESVTGSLSIKAWTQRHPIPTAGAAMLVGITLAAPWSDPKKIETDREPMISRVQVYATLLETGSQILRDVLTPTLLDLLHPKAGNEASSH